MLFKKLRAKKPRKERIASSSVTGVVNDGLVTGPVNDVAFARQIEQARHRDGHLGMQGYPPIIGISRNRQRCDGCKELVRFGVRHICIYNAHHHLDTLTAEERLSLMDQLRNLGVKAN